ncbi:MAG TPA: ABC transporter ATP-binding protein [Planctomycetota bacterium]|nr:ABC transporter ATP-binding protein [Planctomycetota bacterium]
MPTVLAATHLSRSFGAVQALRDVSLELAAGELAGLAGPSGSGKTTLLHLLAAIDTPTGGAVRLLGREVSGLSRGQRAALRLAHVGLVFAEHNLSPALTVAENVELPMALAGRPAAERAARTGAALERLGLGALGGRFPEQLSSGQRQRGALARALAGEPALLLMDEPTAHLDSVSAAGLVERVAELVRERDVAALLASHDPQVLSRCARVITLRDGALEAG